MNPKINKNLNLGILHLWPKFGDPSLNRWWVIVPTSSKWGKFLLWSLIWPWRSMSITPQNNIDLNQGILHLWSKFGDPRLNGWRVIARTSWGLTHTYGHTQTDAGNDNTRRPKLASGKKGEISCFVLAKVYCLMPFVLKERVVGKSHWKHNLYIWNMARLWNKNGSRSD